MNFITSVRRSELRVWLRRCSAYKTVPDKPFVCVGLNQTKRLSPSLLGWRKTNTNILILSLSIYIYLPGTFHDQSEEAAFKPVVLRKVIEYVRYVVMYKSGRWKEFQS